MSYALEGFVNLALDKDVNYAFGNKKKTLAGAGNDIHEDGEEHDHEVA